ncbi:MAG: adenylate/guanylate cyclase domain-containing protein [Anaerolineae bacterium]
MNDSPKNVSAMFSGAQGALAFIPWHVIEDLREHPNPLAREQRLTAVALFADVSGFTVISEALGKTGRAGTEELTSLLNSYFDPMIDLIESYGGIVGKFGGDAMTVLFPYTAATQADTVRRAVQCALEMQVNMQRYEALPTSVGTYGLTMKAGLAMGTVLVTTVGEPNVRLEYIIAGEPLDLCADAEHHATKGEVVVHDDLLAYTGEIEIIERRDGFTRVGAFAHTPSRNPLESFTSLSPELSTFLLRYLHPRIAELVRTGYSDFMNEHRRVTVLFASFSGFDYDNDPQVGDKLKAYLGAVIRTANRYDGYVNKIDMGDKGSKYLILFGAPVTHENDDERALRCAYDLNHLPDALVRIGVNTGYVYCGQVGSEKRKEYTVMGDAVNLSARLMQYAKPGEIVVSGFTNRLPANAFLFEDRDPIMVKGKSEPIPIRLLFEALHPTSIEIPEVHYQIPMIGREGELNTALTLMDKTQNHQGQILGITAEAGMGKSRMAQEIMQHALMRGFSVHRGECLSYGTNSAYLVWQSIWRSLFKLDPTLPSYEQITRLRDQLIRIDPALVQRLPLVGDMLNLAIPDNELTEELEPRLRQGLLSSLLLTCMRWYARQSPLMLVVEDSHWIDDPSLVLLEFLGRNVRDLPVMIVQVYRPPVGQQAVQNPLVPFSHFTEISLTEFSPAEAEQLVQAKLEQLFVDVETIPTELMHRIQDRAQGNPFYIEELMNLIRERNIDPEDDEALQTLELPESLQSLIVSRIDYLMEQEKLTIKVASVIGRLFRASWLWGSYPEVGQPDAIKDQLQRLNGLEIVLEDRPEPELEYLFKHVLTQEVAYESLAYATRETLHDRIGTYIEKVFAENINSAIDVLAYHFGRSRNLEKQRVYFRLAGDAARREYNTKAALDLYARVRPLLAGDDLIDVLLSEGQVLQLIGQYEAADASYQAALALTQSGTAQHARAQALYGGLLLFTQSPAEAERILVEARTTFEHLQEERGLEDVLKSLASAYAEQGNFADALHCAEDLLVLASAQQDPFSLSQAHLNLARNYINQGNLGDAFTHLQESLQIAEDSGHRYGVVAASSDLAGVYYFQGDFQGAMQGLIKALHVAQEIGFLQGIGLIAANMGELYRQEQNFVEALTCYSYSLEVSDELGNPNIALQLGNISTVYMEQEYFDWSERLFALTIDLARILSNPISLCEFLYHMADLRYRQGRYDEGIALNDEAREVATEIGRQDIQFEALVLDVRLHHAAGTIDTAGAIDALEDMLPHWEMQQADLYYAIWQLDPTQPGLEDNLRTAYEQLYTMLPNRKHYQRAQTFGVPGLVEPPALPTLPPDFRQAPYTFEEVVEIAEQYI